MYCTEDAAAVVESDSTLASEFRDRGSLILNICDVSQH